VAHENNKKPERIKILKTSEQRNLATGLEIMINSLRHAWALQGLGEGMTKEKSLQTLSENSW